MKIYNPSISKQVLGGGHTFRRNFEKCLAKDATFVPTWQEADIYFISSVTLVDKGEVHEAKRAGKKIVLRVDNMPRKSRNSRMSPHERMKEYANMADAVIYQSKWAQNWIGSYLGKKGVVIYNSADEDIFYPIPDKTEYMWKHYLISQYNRDDNKRIPEAFDLFTKAWLENNKHHLTIIGNFSPELVSAGFDFFRGENVTYLGVISDPIEYAAQLRTADVLIYPTYSDACPNTVIEAFMSGVDVLHTGWEVITELYEKFDKYGREYFSLPRMRNEYYQLFTSL